MSEPQPPSALRRSCFLCESVGILTVANSPEPLSVMRRGAPKNYPVCRDCHHTHYQALQRGLRTMFDRLFGVEGINGRANMRRRVVRTARHPAVTQ